MITDSSVYAEPSWADTLKGYRQTTNALPWRPEQHAPTQRVTTHTVARKQRELDPLLMRFRDPAREAARSAQEAATAAERLDAAWARQLHYEQRFDIVNHRPRGGGGDDDARQPAYRQRPPDTRLTFNILNHQTLPGHPEPAARSAPEGEAGEAAAVPPARSRKPYNILNNRFLHDHDGKVAAERAAAAARTEEQFWQTHDYHPIEGRYYHPDKEKEFEALRRAAAAVHGQAQRRRLPPSVVHSEGQTYDILTAAAKDARRAAEAEAIADRALRQKQGARTEAAQKTRALEEEDLAAARSLGRVHPARFASTSGYDPLTNVGFQGRTGQPRPPAHPQAPARAFDRARHDHRGGGPPTAAAAAAATGPLDVFGRPAAVAGAGGWALGGGAGAAAAPGAAASSRGGGDRGGGLAAAGGESLRSASARSGAYYRDSPGGGSRGGLSSAPSGKGGSTFGEGSGRPLVPKLTIPKLPSSSRSAVRTGGFNQ